MPDDDTTQTAGTQGSEETTENSAANSVATFPPDAQFPPSGEEALGDAGKAALDRERSARKQAEKDAKERQKRIDALEAEKLSETEKLKREADQGRTLAQQATGKLRRAGLLTALGAEGLVGPRAKAAARLIDGVEYDDDDEPTNLADRIEAAKAEYGEEMFSAPTPQNDRPNLHQGPRRDARGADEDERFAAYMQQHFPEAAEPAGAP